jgi:uncharacterized protein YqeY
MQAWLWPKACTKARAGTPKRAFAIVARGFRSEHPGLYPSSKPIEPTMSLKLRISDDMKAAMRAKEVDRLGTIRMLMAAMKQKEVDERVELDDAMIVAIVDKLIKQRKDAAQQYEAGARQDLADKEKAEIVFLEVYLPQRLSADEVLAAVKAIVAEIGASGPGDMGKVMGVVKQRLAGQADMGQVSAAVKAALAG